MSSKIGTRPFLPLLFQQSNCNLKQQQKRQISTP